MEKKRKRTPFFPPKLDDVRRKRAGPDFFRDDREKNGGRSFFHIFSGAFENGSRGTWPGRKRH